MDLSFIMSFRCLYATFMFSSPRVSHAHLIVLFVLAIPKRRLRLSCGKPPSTYVVLVVATLIVTNAHVLCSYTSLEGIHELVTVCYIMACTKPSSRNEAIQQLQILPLFAQSPCFRRWLLDNWGFW
jgi:hypothetical protein